MADVTIYFTGYDSITQTYNSGGYNQDVAFTGLASGLGSVTVVEGSGVTVSASGSAGTSSIGSVTVTEGTGVTVEVTGETATGAISSVLIWTEVATSQTPNWTEIAA